MPPPIPPPNNLSLSEEQLSQRDPDGRSLLSVLLRAAKDTVTQANRSEQLLVNCTAVGPGDDQYMSPELIEFVCNFVLSGATVCPHELEPSECATGN